MIRLEGRLYKSAERLLKERNELGYVDVDIYLKGKNIARNGTFFSKSNYAANLTLTMMNA